MAFSPSQSMSLAFASAGQSGMSDQLRGSYGRALALGRSSLALAQVGLSEEAIELALKSLEATEAVKDEYQKTNVLGVVSQALQLAGHHEKALESLKSALTYGRLKDSTSVFLALQYGAASFADIDDGQTISDICALILEIKNWWEEQAPRSNPRPIA
jgi:tetratricopeptide (TPR) repeat protein